MRTQACQQALALQCSTDGRRAEEHAHAGARKAKTLRADLNEVCDQAVIKVLAAQVRVARRRLDLLHSKRLSVASLPFGADRPGWIKLTLLDSYCMY